MKAAISLFCTAILAASVAAQSGSPGSLSGVSSDEDGVAVPGTLVYQRLVLYSRSTAHSNSLRLVPGEVEVRGAGAMKPDGSFAIPNLSAGSYIVCARPLDDQYVDSCEWDPPVHVTVKNSATIPPLPHFKKGSPVLIHVLDPHSMLLPVKNSPMGLGIIIGVRDSKRKFHPAHAKASGTDYYDFSITVPMGEKVDLWMFSRTLVVKDAKGAAIPKAGYSSPLQLADTSGASATFTIAGVQ